MYLSVPATQHHEELYHNTPETQTEEAYTHPEDLAHFEHHEDIEREEEDKARKAQGLPPTDPNIPLDDQTAQPDHDAIDARNAQADQQRQQVFVAGGSGTGKAQAGLDDPTPEEAARRERAKQARDQSKRLSDAKKEAQNRGAWGEGGDSGFKKPKDQADRLRDRIPYK